MKRPERPLTHQTGAALIVALVLLVLVTLLGVAGLRTVSLEEKMAGGTYDRSIAFQAAEAALRAGEAVAGAQAHTSPPNSGFPTYTDESEGSSCPSNAINNCVNGLCPTPDKDCPPRWQDAGFTGWTNAANAANVSSLAGTPQYFVEYLGNTFPCGGSPDPNNCKRYRITARSDPTLGDGRAAVVLQSIYATD
jgi:type IV pilus assembly protein PilX